MPKTDNAALDVIFRNARSHNGWLDGPVDGALLQQVYELRNGSRA